MIPFLPKSFFVIHSTATPPSYQTTTPHHSPLSPCQASLSPSSSPTRSSMASVQSLTVTRSPSAVLAPIAASSVSSLPASLKSASLPAFSGLRIRSATSVRQLRPVRSAARRAGRIVCESPETATEAPAVTDSTWQSLVLDSDTPVLVEFWAPWCGPCRMIHPVIDELAKQYSGKLKCFKVNTDESPSIATRYGIRSIPTVIIFKNGEKKEAVIGAVPKATLTSSIDKFL